MTNWLLVLCLCLCLLIGACNKGPGGANEMAPGVDVSHYQGNINWDSVKNDGIVFAYAKATGGTGYTDPAFNANWHGMRASGITRGAYHFFYPNEDAQQQAQFFLKTVGPLLDSDMPPMIDIEVTDNASSATICQDVLTWCQTVEEALGITPIIYTDLSFGNSYLTDPELGDYPLWVADYSPSLQGVPPPWQKTGQTIWQYSQSGQISGISGNVDLDQYNGTVRDLERFIKNSRSSTPEEESDE